MGYSKTVNENPDSLAIPSSSNVSTPTPQTSQPTVGGKVVGTATPEGDRPTGDSMTVNEDPHSPDSLAAPEEANPVSKRPIRIKVIGPRTPPGYISSDSESNVERLVLHDTDM